MGNNTRSSRGVLALKWRNDKLSTQIDSSQVRLLNKTILPTAISATCCVLAFAVFLSSNDLAIHFDHDHESNVYGLGPKRLSHGSRHNAKRIIPHLSHGLGAVRLASKRCEQIRGNSCASTRWREWSSCSVSPAQSRSKRLRMRMSMAILTLSLD